MKNGRCACNDGFISNGNGNSCIQSSFQPNQSCPKNAHFTENEKGEKICICNDGYGPDQSNQGCIAKKIARKNGDKQDSNANISVKNKVIDLINEKYGNLTIAPSNIMNRSTMPDVIAPAWKPSGHRQTI